MDSTDIPNDIEWQTPPAAASNPRSGVARAGASDIDWSAGAQGSASNPQAQDSSTRASDYVKAPIAGLVEGIGSGIAGIGSLGKLVSPAHYTRQLTAKSESPVVREMGNVTSTIADAIPNALQWAGGKINDAGQWIEGTESDAAKQAQAQPIVQGQLLHPSTWKLGAGATLPGVVLKGESLLGNLAPMVVAPEAAGARVLGAAGKAAGELGEAANAIRAGKAIGELSPEVAQAATKLTRSVGRAKQITGAGVGGVQMAEGQAQGEQARIAQMPQDQLEQVPAYQQAIAAGMTPDQARAHVAQNAHDAAFAATLPLAVAQGGISTLPLLNDTQGVLSRAVGKSRLARGVAGAALEAPVQGGAFVGQNAADIAAVNATTGEKRSPMEDSLATFGSGAVMGAAFGGIGGLHRAEPFPGAAPGTLSDAANTLHRTAGPAPEAQAQGEQAGAESKPVTVKAPAPPAPWINPETGETRTPAGSEVVAALHGLLDQKAAAQQNGQSIMFAPKDVAASWGLPLERVKTLMRVTANERKQGVTTEQAQQRAAQEASAPENPNASTAATDTTGVSVQPETAAPEPAQPDLLTNPKAEVSDRQKARIAQRVRGGGVAPGLLDAAAEEATAGAKPQTETPPPGGVSASEPSKEEPNHGLEQPAQRSAPLDERGAAAGAGEPNPQGEGTAAPAAAGHGSDEQGPTRAGGHDAAAVDAAAEGGSAAPAAGGAAARAASTGAGEGGAGAARADTAGLENALAKTDRATGPDGATYLVKENSNGEGYHFNRLEDGSSTQHRNADQAQPWTREEAINAAAQMARERASAKPSADASAGADAGTAAPRPSAQESAQAGQATAAEPVSQASEPPKASNAAETTTKTPETQAAAVNAEKPDVEAAAQESAAHPENPRPEPTPAQHEAGNFKMGHVNLHGLDVTIEVPKGGVRRGTDAQGKPWERAASDHYGYIRRSAGADGEQVDVYLGAHAEHPNAKVFVIDQVKPGTKAFDEHKAMVGFASGKDARRSYAANFPNDVKTFGGIREMSMDDFKRWVKEGDTTKPVTDKVSTRAPKKAAPAALKEGDRVEITKGGFKGEVGELRGVAGPDLRNVVITGTRKAGVHAIHISALRKAEEAPASKPVEASHATGTAGVEPVRRVGEAAAESDHGADAVRDEAGTATPITDIGEKIGGARKDTAVKTGPLPKRATTEDTRPTWAKRYEISQIVSSSKEGEKGRWAIHDVRVKDWRDQPKLATRETFATKEEAEHALPLLELARNHGVSYRGEGNYGIYRKVTDQKRVILKDGFATPEDAKRYMAQHAQDLIETKTSVGEEALPKPETVRREGPPRREGDVKPQQFRDTFGFRGVEFGNWNNQAERQEVMNHAFDGLHDLAEVLNIPPKAISLNGELGLAFGARGQGLSGARAHYERDRVVMNLTKMRGAGALAHEWFHALDHYLARESGATSKQWVTKADGTRVLKVTGDNARDFASYGAGRPSALREELRSAYDTLINTMQRTATTFVRDTTKLETFVGRSRTEMENKLAQLRRVLEKPSDYGAKSKRAAAGAEQLAEVDAISRRLINGENLELKMEPNKAAPGRRFSSSYRQTNDDLERLSAILKSVRGYSGFRADGIGIMHDIANAMKHYRVRLLEAADARTHPEAQTTKPTSFRMEAVKADQGRGTNYWSTHHEMAARAFSAYVEDKLAEQGHSSDFLSYGSDERFRLLIPELPRPFPGGEERAAIDKAFDTFFATIRHEETPEGNVRLFSRRGWDGFPDAVVAHKPGTVRENPDYAAAKGGDDAAALRLAKDVVTPEFIDAVRRAIPKGSKPTIVPVLAVEEAGKNRIPLMAAKVLGEKLDLPVGTDIVQSRKVSRGGSDAMHRVAVQPTFEGTVKPGDYILMDDTLAQGGTLAQLKTHIEDNGGRVVLATALTGKDFSRKLALEPKTLDEVRERFGSIENWWRDTFGHGFEGLTQSEARAILAYKPSLRPDALRDLVAKARNESLGGVGGRATGGGSQSRPLNPLAQALHGELARSKVQEIVDRATAKWGSNRPSVQVKADAEGLPDSAKRDPGYKTAEGYYDHETGTAYLVASNLRSEDRVRQVLAHEVVGHHGVEHIVDSAFGAGAWQKIEDSVAKLEGNPKVSEKVKEVLAETRRRYPDADARTFAKEFLAVSAEKGVRTGLLNRVVSAIRTFLRKVMPSLKISEADLRQTLARAQDYVRRGERYADRVARIQAMVFSRQPDTFYSALAESVGRAEGAPKKGTAEQWKQWLDGAQRRGEFKGAEREWMGVDQWLDTHKGEPITRAEVQQFARDNQVRLQEVMHGDEPPSNAADIHENEDGSFDLTDETGALANTPDRPTKFSEYTLPGGKNYRELLLTLPGERLPPGYKIEQRDDGFHLLNETGTDLGTWRTADAAERSQARHSQNPAFQSSHFEEPNILAHVRFNDRTGPDGEKILHVEEVQSDWHQAGRKRGYNTPATRDGVARELYGKPYDELDATTRSAVDGEVDGRNNGTGGAEERSSGVVPDAPFKKEWPLLAMKRVLRYAAEHGYDKVTWTTGEQQAARYDLSKQVDAVRVMPAGRDDAVHVMVKPKGSSEFQGIGDVSAIPKAKLPEVLGKDLAERALRDTADGKVAEYSGVDMKVGGEGMHAFYDKMLPNELNKYAKQWGAKVGETSFATGKSKFVSTRVASDGKRYWVLGYDHNGREHFASPQFDTAIKAMDAADALKRGDATVHSIDITPAMREGVMHGQPMFSRPEAATMDDLDEVRKARASGGDDSAFKRAKAVLAGKYEDLRPKLLGALQTRHVLELARDLPILKGHADQYERSMQQMAADREQLMVGAPDAKEHPDDMLAKGAVPIAQALRDFTYEKGPAGWLGRRRPEAQKLFDLMHQSTLWGMDPDKEYSRLTIENAHGDAIPWTREAIKQRMKLLRELALQRGGDPQAREGIRDELRYLRNLPKMEKTREQRWPELVRQWQALPDEAKDLYRQVRDWYSAHRDATEQALIHNIEAMDVPETYRRSLVNRMRLRFEEARREGVYFPLNRDGDYWIAFQDKDGNEGFKMAETFKDAQATEKKLRAAGFKINSTGRRDHNLKAAQAPSGTFVREVIDILKKAGVSEQTQDQVYQSFLQSLPEMSMRKHSIHRRNIAGFSEDGLRAFAKNGFHGAHQLARLRHAQDMQISLEAMQQSVNAYRKGSDELGENPSGATLKDTAKADALVGELAKRHQWIMNPSDTQLANMANSIGFVYYLGASPASALTNLTQVVQTVLPVLGAQHGWPKAMRVLGAAWRDAARTGGHLDRTLTNEDEKRAFLVMQQRGDFSKTQAHTLAGLAEGNVLQTSPGWTKTMNAVSWMFHTAEVINREATGMAAFRLARAQGKDFNEAIKYAGDINAGTNFDYAAANRPRLMQNNTARIALQFKQYSLGMTWLFYRNLYQAMKGETPEIRRQARRTVTGIMGMTALLAGTTGLPVYNGVKMAANAANLAFGDPDEPFDFDTEFHNWLADNLGQDAANVIATGPVSEVTGADFARRTSMSNLWFQDADRNLEGADAYHALLESLAGPMGGITKNFYVGAQRIREGNVQRGIETMLPTSVKNAVKALRFAHDGANTLRGDPILPDVSTGQDFVQALGFTPTKLAQQERVNSALVEFTQAVQERRQTLLNGYAMAVHTGDPEDRAAVMDKIRAFNQQYPAIAISPKVIMRSLRSRAQYSARAVNGLAISPKLRPQAEMFAGANQGAAQ